MIHPRVARIVAGGQTGADRAALDFARERGIPYGGWCPRGGWAEDHPVPPGLLDGYPGLRETPSADVDQRTAWNVRDSDATLILVAEAHAPRSPGTELTLTTARSLGRPCAVVATDDPERRRRVSGLLDPVPWGTTLNVAGPRESESPGLYRACRRFLDEVADLLQ